MSFYLTSYLKDDDERRLDVASIDHDYNRALMKGLLDLYTPAQIDMTTEDGFTAQLRTAVNDDPNHGINRLLNQVGALINEAEIQIIALNASEIALLNRATQIKE